MFELINETINTWSISYLEQWPLALGLFFIAGILASLFPCVYPLYPITAGFLRNRSSELEAKWKHPLAYWMGMMLVYPFLGALAVLSGGAFNSLMQNGIVILCIGFLFLYLSFVTLDWVSLQFQFGDKWNQKLVHFQGLPISLIMGVVSGLVSSACVAPVLVSMLLVLSQKTKHLNVLELMRGLSLCLSFGGGMGFLFFLTGVFGTRLPRVGLWQKGIKAIFALLMLVASMYQIEKGLKVLHWDENSILPFLSSLIFIFLASFLRYRLFKTHGASYNTKAYLVGDYFRLLLLSLGISLLVYAFMLQAIKQNFSSLYKKHSMNLEVLNEKDINKESNENFYEEIGGLHFYRNYNFALKLAQKENKKIFIDFFGEWCTNCVAFNNDLKNSSASILPLKKTLSQNILVKIYDDDDIFNTFSKKENFSELKIGLPFFTILDSKGNVLWKTINYKDYKGMIQALNQK